MSADKWSALLNDDWNKPVKSDNGIGDETPEIIFKDGNDAMSSFYKNISNSSKPKMKILKRTDINNTKNVTRDEESGSGSSADGKDVDNKSVTPDVERLDKIKAYNEARKKIFNDDDNNNNNNNTK
ncbi:hypothetical protein PACTADRAFT_49099 [Pachysolen tannophilus NRRL Y-2460]|uniref:SUZ domain-containing protein n=1 Tax=Pachysolen tannophilus NRRL Y-2460 TaxID=669874 RepID=A0A1E4U0C8_PACTA|nr:hypothetical protein PACTADRAFT_49099 [Pachysolen tannophilus NRRL Y-2460]